MPVASCICTRRTARPCPPRKRGCCRSTRRRNSSLPDLAYHDYEGVALDLAERPRLQRDLGAKNIMLLHNHGTLTVGRTCAQAYLRMYFLERACTMQVRTRMLGDAAADHPTAPDVIEKNAALAQSGGLSMLAEQLVWPALLRKLDRLDPGFRH